MMTSNGITQLSYNQIQFSDASPFNAESNFEPINHYFEQRSLDELLTWSLQTFGDRIAQVTSFGPSGMVILDYLARLSPGFRVITLDTQFLFDETYALMDEITHRYPIRLDVRRPEQSPDQQAKTCGPQLWTANPDLCCHLRKVVPLTLALDGLDAWITGLRRDQSLTRQDLPLVAWDQKYELVKINPLAHWSRDRVWKYLLKHNVPYNSLHNRGYASIGCTHCTHPTANAADERSGRWQNHAKTECGIHLISGYNAGLVN